MGGICKTGGASLALLGAVQTFAGCMLFEQPEIIDLARNGYLYHSSTYEAPRSVATQVYVARLIDKRKLPDLNTGASYRQIYSDTVWDRLPPVMVEELLIDSILRSKIYSGISSGDGGTPAPTDVILRPTLLEMYRMHELMVGGGMTGYKRTMAVTTIRIQVEGPENSNGIRPILMDETFQDAVGTKPGLGRPDEGLVLAGKTLENIVKRMLQKVYESNVAVTPASAGRERGQAKSGAPKQASPKK